MVIERLMLKRRKNVRSSTVTRAKERKKETSDCGHQVQRNDSPLRNQKSVTRKAQAVRKRKSTSCSSDKKGSC